MEQEDIIGIDEVGRGAWAGPLVVGAVQLLIDIPGLKDSKKLSPKKRKALADLINESAVFVGLGWVSPGEVDDLGLTAATRLACVRALENAPEDAAVVIDGNYNYLPGRKNCTVMVGADGLIPAVSAASIVAKVARDEFMEERAKMYPTYGFEKHVGYGTKKHREAIDISGLTPIHRWSYKNFRDKFFVEFRD